MTEKFIIGTVTSPHGLKGFVKIRSASGEVEHLLKLKSVIIKKDGKEQLFQIEETALAPPCVLMRFTGIDNPEKAKSLSGVQLIAGREQACPLADGEFYIEDLKGLPVVTKDGERIGFINDIIEGGGGELAEIKIREQETEIREQLKKGENRLVPFRREFFPEINLEKGRVVIDNLWVLE